MMVIYIINVVNCLICFTITIIFYNDIKNRINNNNHIIDYLKSELMRNNNNYIELSNEKYKNLCLNSKLKSQSKKIEEQIEKINKYHNIITVFNNNRKKQSLFLNKSEIVREKSKKLIIRKYFSCNDLMKLI